MAYRKFDLNGREMLNLDNLGMVDYDEYYSIWHRSIKRREDICDKYISMQNTNRLENEPDINYPYQYTPFLEELKSINSEMYNKKLIIYEKFEKELEKEANVFNDEKQQLLIKGYQFDKEFKRYGKYVIKIDNNYFLYTQLEDKKVKIDMGPNLLPQNAIIQEYDFVPVTIEELQQQIKEIIIKRRKAEEYKQNGFISKRHR